MKQLSMAAALLLIPVAGLAAENGLRPPFQLALGKQLFEQNCAKCHGQWAGGTDKGPPLTHRYYLPNHHGDEAFYRAALNGVRAHHWQFGDMPPVPGMSSRKMDRIVPYVRWLQQQKFQRQGG